MNPFVHEKVENWVGDFCVSDDLRPFAPAVKEVAADVLVQFMAAACEHRGVEPDELDEPDVKHALLTRIARLTLSESTKKEMPELCSALLTHLEKSGRLGGGQVLGAYVQALQGAFDEASSGKRTPITRPGSKIGRNDPCPCGSGLKYKKCCMNA